MKLCAVKGDITKLKDVDAIVNAANTSLLGGGGVDGAIHRAAGPDLLKECRTLNGCPTGEARITGAYRLPCRYVIHTPGPVWQGGGKGEPELLRGCYLSCMELAAEHKVERIAFPAISTGIYGYPKWEAARIAVDTVMDFMKGHPEDVREAVFVLFDEESYGIYQELISEKECTGRKTCEETRSSHL